MVGPPCGEYESHRSQCPHVTMASLPLYELPRAWLGPWTPGTHFQLPRCHVYGLSVAQAPLAQESSHRPEAQLLLDGIAVTIRGAPLIEACFLRQVGSQRRSRRKHAQHSLRPRPARAGYPSANSRSLQESRLSPFVVPAILSALGTAGRSRWR